MRVNKGFVLNEVCGERFLIPMGEKNIDLSKLVSFNESSYIMWKHMEKGEFTVDDLVKVLLEEFEVDEAKAREDVNNVLEMLIAEGVVFK